jgi:thioredoxin reductase
MTHVHEFVIIGAGPGGLQLGYYLEQARRDYVILERAHSPGNFFARFPRHRRLISANKVHTGYSGEEEKALRFDWNSLLTDEYAPLFTSYSRKYYPLAGERITYLSEYADAYSLKIQYGAGVSHVSKEGDLFLIRDAAGRSYRARVLICATGMTAPYIPAIPGIEHAESYVDFSVDQEEFQDQRVLIIGKGNSALETANNLTESAAAIHLCSPHPVTLAWQSHYVGHVRAVNVNFLDTYQLKLQNAIIDADVLSVERLDGRFLVKFRYTHAKEEERVIWYDRVLLCTGFRFDQSIFAPEIRPTLVYNNRLPALTSDWESENVPGLYFAGTLTQSRDYRHTMSGFIHGFRYNIRALSRLLLCRGGSRWPHTELPLAPDRITAHVQQLLNADSAIFLQPGFICHALVIRAAEGRALYYEGIPAEHAPAMFLGQEDHYYLVTLEYGDFGAHPDPFAVARDPAPSMAHQAVYLHPIVRRYRRGKLVEAFHVPEDLENDYSGPMHNALIMDLFSRELAGRP